ncbi:S8 family serine peptidase, partial [Rhizobium brockwellii]
AQKIKVVSSSLNQGGNSTWGQAVTRFGATGGLIVNSAGNNAAANPADAAAIDASNVNAIIFVGALSPNIQAYTIESYSNRAGTMKD